MLEKPEGSPQQAPYRVSIL